MTKKKTEEFITWFPVKGGLGEIYQSNQVQFSFVTSPKEGNKQCHPWVLCRDFLHDAVKAEITKTTQGIFGFTFTGGKNPPVDLDKMRMLVRHKNHKDADKFQPKIDQALKLINRFETLGKLKETHVIKIEDKTDIPVWLFAGEKEWVRSPFMVSLYTYLIRLGTDSALIYKDTGSITKMLTDTANENKTSSGNDLKYLQKHHDKLEKIMSNYRELFYKDTDIDKSYTDVDNIGTFHNSSGILNLCTGGCQRKDLNALVTKTLSKKTDKKGKAVSKKP